MPFVIISFLPFIMPNAIFLGSLTLKMIVHLYWCWLLWMNSLQNIWRLNRVRHEQYLFLWKSVWTDTHRHMHACMHTYTHAYTNAQTYTNTNEYMHNTYSAHKQRNSHTYKTMWICKHCTIAHTHKHKKTHMHTYAQLCKCIFMYAHTAYTHIPKHVNVHILHIYTFTQPHTYKHMNTHTHTHMYTHVHTQSTYTQKFRLVLCSGNCGTLSKFIV